MEARRLWQGALAAAVAVGLVWLFLMFAPWNQTVGADNGKFDIGSPEYEAWQAKTRDLIDWFEFAYRDEPRSGFYYTIPSYAAPPPTDMEECVWVQLAPNSGWGCLQSIFNQETIQQDIWEARRTERAYR